MTEQIDYKVYIKDNKLNVESSDMQFLEDCADLIMSFIEDYDDI